MDAPRSDGPKSRTGRRFAGAAAVLALAFVILAGAGLYLARQAIAERLARQWLAGRGVASHLTLRSLSLTGLSASLRLGDPANPDLTVERLDVEYALSGFWSGKPLGVQTRALRLVRPRLRLRVVGGRLSLGALDPLIREALKRPPTGGPQPDVTVEGAEVLLLTPGGPLRLTGGGQLRGGALTALDARADPFVVTVAGARLQAASSRLRLTRQGGRLLAAGRLDGFNAIAGADRLGVGRLDLTGELPYPTRDGRWAGPLRMALAETGLAIAGGGARADGGVIDATLDGTLGADPAHLSFTGALRGAARLDALSQPAARLRGATARLAFAHLTLAGGPAGVTMSGDGQAALAAAGAEASGIQLTRLASALRVTAMRVAVRQGRVTAAAVLDGAASGQGAVAPAEARRLAMATPLVSGEAPYAAAMERALQGFRFTAPSWRAVLSEPGAQLTLGAPLSLQAASGVRLTATPAGAVSFAPGAVRGGFDLALEGGGMPPLKLQARNASLTGSAYRADLAAEGALDALFARGAHLALKGRLAGDGPRLRFDLAGCAPVSAERLAFDPNPVLAFSASLCPGPGPLIGVGAQGWTTQGRLQAAGGEAPSFTASLRQAAGAFEASGRQGRLDDVALQLDRGEIIDAAAPIRFRPVAAAGRLSFAAGVWRGGFTMATGAGRTIGKIDIRHDTASGAGRADIDASSLVFAPAALQPAQLAPAASFLSQADGPAGFRGWFAWGSGGATSGGELVARSLKFKSPVGAVLGIDADIRFASLSPLVTAPAQTIRVGLVQAMTPLSALSAQFELGADSVSIASAGGSVAKGRIHLEPTSASLAPGSTLKGVLVLDQVNLGDIIAASSLADTIKLDAVVNGRIPFEIGPSGLTIQQGRVAAVKPGRLSISRQALTGGKTAVAPSPAPSGQAGFAQDLAYQAMENLAFDQLEASVNSLPNERLGVIFHLKGRHDPPRPQRAVIALNDLVGGRALSKPIALPSNTRIDLTLDTSLNFGELVRALGQAWRDSTGDGGAAGRSGAVHGAGPPMTTNERVRPP